MRIRRLALIAACGFAVRFAAHLNAQTAAPATSAPAGLDSLSDDRLMADLANRGQGALLEHAMESNHVSPAQRDAYRGLLALHALNDPSAHLSASQRAAMARKSAA